jgi:YHYH protein
MLDKRQKQKLKIKLPNQEPSNRTPYFLMAGTGFVALVIAAIGMWFLLATLFPRPNPVAETKLTAPTPKAQTSTPSLAETPQLDIAKSYGNKYANGLLPVGDSKYSTTSAKKGSLYVCSQYAQNLTSDKGGASTRGPWFTNNNTQYDINKKVHIHGSVSWKGSFSNTVANGKRTITTNDLPLAHTTGTFPVSSSDPAYSYDRNPNTISAQSLTYNLAASPTYGTPQCMGGEVGVMLTGVAIFNAFDAGGRDAGAWEVQDDCSGHPQSSGEYHYHTLSSCIQDVSVHTVIGFALDGFPITGPQVSSGNVLTTDDLDECHGISSQITLDGKQFTSYHYVMTQDFPYSVSCFRATPASPPGMQGGQQQSTQSQSQGSAPTQGQQSPGQTTGGQVGGYTPQTPPPPQQPLQHP